MSSAARNSGEGKMRQGKVREDGEEGLRNEKRRKLVMYLERQVKEGKTYFKSKFISESEEIDMSPREIGSNMPYIAETYEGLKIEKWSHAKATTWRVEKE